MMNHMEIITDLKLMEKAWEEHLPLVAELDDPKSNMMMQKFMVLALIYHTHRRRQKSQNISLRDFSRGIGVAYTMAESYSNLVEAFPDKSQRAAFYEETIKSLLNNGALKPS